MSERALSGNRHLSRQGLTAQVLDVMALTDDPLWQPKDLGKPLPDDPHACSVAMPTWDSVIGYEEGHQKILKKLRCGYPRFLINDFVDRLFSSATQACAEEGETALVFPRRTIAQRAQRFVELQSRAASRIASYEDLHALVIEDSLKKVALEYWRYTGEVTSSRLAEDTLAGNVQPADPHLIYELSQILAGYAGAEASDVFLFESGMAGIFSAHRAITQLFPGKKTLQMEFPYVDAMRVQQNFGSGVVYLNTSAGEDFDEALQRIRRGEFSAVFCEIASNPLLRCIDLPEVASACRAGGVILIVDDTVSSNYNVDALAHADIVTTSLTKWTSGRGDVMAGQVTLNRNSPAYSDLHSLFSEFTATQRLYTGDAAILLRNVKTFHPRISQVNKNGEALYEFLKNRPDIDQVWYPKEDTVYRYESVKTPHGGYGGLISFQIKGAEKRAQTFYDALEVCKGPGLGTEFTLVCPYTLLAHYDDLEWAADCGVPRNLIRVSCGTEDTELLVSRFEKAFDVLS